MMKKYFLIIIISVLTAHCKKNDLPVVFEKYDESVEISNQQNHENERMRFKLIQSNYLDMNEVFKPFEIALSTFSENDYENLKPYILEKDIPTIQKAVHNGVLSYENIALFYLYRIRKFESNHDLALHSIISLNPDILEQAREKDRNWSGESNFSLYGLPILLKDNINTSGMSTTAGTVVLQVNKITDDAFVVKKLKEQGALILGKVNLSEWAYFFCKGCPFGYSAIGGQTLNPYGRKIFETGGSSSGSGVSVAANYAIAAVGTETSGSILSPSSKNSVVGLKPTIGLLSRTGIVPISTTLDTPGPMTKSIIDNAILLSSMLGEDSEDIATIGIDSNNNYFSNLRSSSLNGMRFGVLESLLSDSIYAKSVKIIEQAGGVLISVNPERKRSEGFLTLLNIDMKKDLPNYLKNYADEDVSVFSIQDVVNFNNNDSLKRMPYNQEMFDGILVDSTTLEELELIKEKLNLNGKKYLNAVLDSLKVDVLLSIDSYHANVAAVAKYPCLTVPMGYKKSGEPTNITFLAKPFEEKKLLQVGYAFEQLTKARVIPIDYK